METNLERAATEALAKLSHSDTRELYVVRAGDTEDSMHIIGMWRTQAQAKAHMARMNGAYPVIEWRIERA
jgi:hypothetical protein